MLPSTKLTVGDVLLILRQRARLILVTLALVSATTAAGSLLLPDRYRSETLILVVPQRVPESYVKSTVTTRIEDRLQSITQEILSRTRLERIIDDFNLYAAERRTRLMETIVDDMRKDIDVKVVKGDAFRVAYTGADATTVMQVTNQLASLFIEENLRDRESLAEDTNRFLESQLADARRRLINHEQKLEAYRSRYSGELPSQLASNLQVIQSIELQLQSLVDSANRDIDRRALLERQLREVEREVAIDATNSTEGPTAAPPARSATPAQQLAEAQATLHALEERLTPTHPDVRRMQRKVRDLQAEVDAERRQVAAASPGGDGATSASPPQLARQARLADLRLELEQIDRRLASKETEEARLRAAGHEYQRRIGRVPARESELTELTRDYSTLETMYRALLAKQEESKIAADLERRQIGAQFKLLDPARIAEKPFRPRRKVISLIGMAAGLAFGLALVAFLEHRDQTFKTDLDIASELTLPVLAVVPIIESTHEHRRDARRRVLSTCAAAAVVAACVPIVLYSFLH